MIGTNTKKISQLIFGRNLELQNSLKKELVPGTRSSFSKGTSSFQKFLKKELVPGTRSFWNSFLPSPADHRMLQ